MQASAKERIARTAASYIHEGDSIILDSGTTVLSLVQALGWQISIPLCDHKFGAGRLG